VTFRGVALVFLTLMLTGCPCGGRSRGAPFGTPVESERCPLAGTYEGEFGRDAEGVLNVTIAPNGFFNSTVAIVSSGLVVAALDPIKFSSGCIRDCGATKTVFESSVLERLPGGGSLKRWPSRDSAQVVVVHRPPRPLQWAGDEILWPVEWPAADEPVRFVSRGVAHLKRKLP